MSYNRKDFFYSKAKEEGYRSRAAFKLLELNDKYRFLNKNSKVLDLGAWPGGWLQIASEKIGPAGIAVGIDLVEIERLPASNVVTLQGDARDKASIDGVQSAAGGKFDVVLSDMSPKLSGIKELDNTASVECARIALDVSKEVLRSGGTLVIKLFKSQEADTFFKEAKKGFKRAEREELKSTRKTSNEFYFVGNGYLA